MNDSSLQKKNAYQSLFQDVWPNNGKNRLLFANLLLAVK